MVAIFVLTVFLSFIAVDLIVLKIQGRNHPAFEPAFPQVNLSTSTENLAIPSNIFFSKGHTWLKEKKDGIVQIGIDEFGTTALGALSISNILPEGKEIKRGEILFEGTYGYKTVKFLSPVNGIVKSVNTNIINNKITNPYQTWGIELLSRDFPEDQKKFLSGIEAKNWIKNEYYRLKNFIDGHSLNMELAGETMFDGGLLSNDTTSSLIDQNVKDFEKEFLSL